MTRRIVVFLGLLVTACGNATDTQAAGARPDASDARVRELVETSIRNVIQNDLLPKDLRSEEYELCFAFPERARPQDIYVGPDHPGARMTVTSARKVPICPEFADLVARHESAMELLTEWEYRVPVWCLDVSVTIIPARTGARVGPKTWEVVFQDGTLLTAWPKDWVRGSDESWLEDPTLWDRVWSLNGALIAGNLVLLVVVVLRKGRSQRRAPVV